MLKNYLKQENQRDLQLVSEINGIVKIVETKKKREVVVTAEDGEAKNYLIPYGSRLKVSEDDAVEAGDELTEGSVNPHDILKIKGVKRCSGIFGSGSSKSL